MVITTTALALAVALDARVPGLINTVAAVSQGVKWLPRRALFPEVGAAFIWVLV